MPPVRSRAAGRWARRPERRGALGSLRDVLFVFTPHYTALSWVGETFGGMVYWGFTEWLTGYSSVPTVGLFLFFILQPHPRQQPQREAHHAARMSAEPLDCKMGLAGVGGADDGFQGEVVVMRHAGLFAATGAMRQWQNGTPPSFCRT